MDRLLEAARYDAELRGYFIKKRMDDKEALDAIRHYLQLVNMRSYRVVTRLGFIYSAYTEQAWWYELVELMRRFILNGLIGVLTTNSLGQIVCGIMLCFFFLITILWVRPYKLRSDRALAVIAHISLFITLFGGMLLNSRMRFASSPIAADNGPEKVIVEFALVAAHVGTLAFFLTSFIYENLSPGERARLAERATKMAEKQKALMTVLGVNQNALDKALESQMEQRKNGPNGVAMAEPSLAPAVGKTALFKQTLKANEKKKAEVADELAHVQESLRAEEEAIKNMHKQITALMAEKAAVQSTGGKSKQHKHKHHHKHHKHKH
jgi:hypothetical protein